MKKLAFLFVFVLASCATRGPNSVEPISYSNDLFLPINFIENKSHLAMNINYAPVAQIRQNIESQIHYELKNRGEAHITVLTPIEYEILKDHLSMAEINSLVVREGIQKSSFKPLCVGRGRLQIDGKEEETYFIVVESQDLKNLREKIREAYVAKGGSVGDFKADIVYPHITLGYSKRDLHFEDGVIKDEHSCIADLKLKAP
jgi:hypothetical protein